MARNPSLASIFRHHDGLTSDKWESYLSAYDRILKPVRRTTRSVLEVGVQNGGSLEIWRKYFFNAASIIGCDIDSRCQALEFFSPDIRFVFGDITQNDTISRILEISPNFDLIIDDGSHISPDVIGAFCSLFPHLNPGGIYIVEDLHCSYWQRFRGDSAQAQPSMEFFKSLIDIINQEHWESHQRILATAEEMRLEESFISQIHSLEFMNSLCVIKKIPSGNNSLGKRLIAGSKSQVSDTMGLHGSSLKNLSPSRSD